MAREKKKRVELREVDEDVAPRVNVVRLQNTETQRNSRDEAPVRLGPIVSQLAPSRLDVPDRDEVELRTHQPGVEVLVDADKNLDSQEASWGVKSVQKQAVPWGWFALVGVAIVGAALWSLSQMRESKDHAGHIRVETESLIENEEREEKQAIELINRIESSLRAFFNARSADELVRSVRQPERVLPLIRKFGETETLFQGKLKTIRDLQPMAFENRANFWLASVTLENDIFADVLLEIDEAGNPLIDWETWVCDQPMPWDQFARERPAGQSLDFRVFVQRDTFYSHEFSDPKRWVCFRLNALGGEETLFGYVSVDNEDAEKIIKLAQGNAGKSSSLILRIAIPEGLASRRSVVIEKLVSTRWIYLDPPESMP